jgi:glycogen operon protein
MGPTLSFRGVDNASYYRLSPENPRYYMDFTGCGNTLNMQHPRVLALLMDSLRYWVQEMHVDGFRFDLASALARELFDVDRLGSFFDTIGQDPILSQVKLIAEPWDVGAGGYQVGNFPPGWNEWNDRYRDTVRAYWKGDEGTMGDFARRFSGSADLYEASGRKPHASVNFVTAHDGFVLQDLVSYNGKHNEANGEDNRDGNNDNRSWNHGAEGVTDDASINALRAKQKRNLISTLLLSQGVPMLLAGDELGHTQNGNNNAYCQDNEISWLDWDLTADEQSFVEFVAQMIAFRRHHPVFSRRRFLQARTLQDGVKEVAWLRPDGQELDDADWDTSFNRCLGVYMAGTAIERVDKRGKAVKDNNFLVLFNAHHEAIPFLLPEFHAGGAWLLVLDTSNERESFSQKPFDAGSAFPLQARSMVVLIATTAHPALRTHQGSAPAAQPPSHKRPASAPNPTSADAAAALAATLHDASAADASAPLAATMMEAPAANSANAFPAREPTTPTAPPPQTATATAHASAPAETASPQTSNTPAAAQASASDAAASPQAQAPAREPDQPAASLAEPSSTPTTAVAPSNPPGATPAQPPAPVVAPPDPAAAPLAQPPLPDPGKPQPTQPLPEKLGEDSKGG